MSDAESGIARAERLADAERLLAELEAGKAVEADAHAAEGGSHADFYRRAAELHRAAQKAHEAAADLQQRHSYELRGILHEGG